MIVEDASPDLEVVSSRPGEKNKISTLANVRQGNNYVYNVSSIIIPPLSHYQKKKRKKDNI